MTNRLKSGNGPILRPYQKSDFPNFSVTHDIVNVYVSGGTSLNIIVDDAYINRYTNPIYYFGGSIIVNGGDVSDIKNLTPNIASISTDGTITQLNSGVLKCLVKGPITLGLTVDLTNQSGGGTVDNYSSSVLGSLSSHCTNQVDSRIDNTMNMTTNGRIFSYRVNALGLYERNVNLWCKDFVQKLTCESPWNTDGKHEKSGTLITPRHIINAAHFELDVGAQVRFVDVNNTVHTHTIVSKQQHPDYIPNSPDFTVYTLDSDVTSSITPCKLMASDWDSYLSNNYFNRPPCFGTDYEDKTIIKDLYLSSAFRTPIDADRLLFSETMTYGDSGNPVFLTVNDDLVLLTVLTYIGTGNGTPISDFISDINQMIVDSDIQAGVSTVDDLSWPNASGHYQVIEADFSMWPNLTTKNYIIEDTATGNGKPSLWVENGIVNTKMSYIMRESATDYWTLAWTGSAWTFTSTGSPTSVFSDSASDGATPDVATTFGTLNFIIPS